MRVGSSRRIYFLFGFIPIWSWVETVEVNENSKLAQGRGGGD